MHEVGTIFFDGELPSIWPVHNTIILTSKKFIDGKTAILANSNGRIELKVYDKFDNIVLSHQTCPIIVDNWYSIKLAAAWELPRGCTIAINGNIISSSDTDVEILESYKIIERIKEVIPDNLLEEYHDKNIAASSKRHDTYVGSQPKPQQTRLKRQDIREALEDEVHQITDLINYIKQGKMAHVRGLASRLRMLVAMGKPLPLLQLYASTDKSPLIIYTDPKAYNIDERLDGIDPTHSVKLSIWPTPVKDDNIPIDLDVWLEFTFGRVGSTRITNEKMLNVLGNKIGSHFDQDVPPSILMLKSITSELGKFPIETDFVVTFLVRVGEAVLGLADSVLNRKITFSEKDIHETNLPDISFPNL